MDCSNGRIGRKDSALYIAGDEEVRDRTGVSSCGASKSVLYSKMNSSP